MVFQLYHEKIPFNRFPCFLFFRFLGKVTTLTVFVDDGVFASSFVHLSSQQSVRFLLSSDCVANSTIEDGVTCALSHNSVPPEILDSRAKGAVSCVSTTLQLCPSLN